MPKCEAAVIGTYNSAKWEEEQRDDLLTNVVETELVKPVKRKRVRVECSSSDNGEFNLIDDDDDEYVVKQRTSRRKSTRSKLTTASGIGRRKSTTVRPPKTPAGPENSLTPLTQTQSHPASIHKIEDPLPLRTALLAWYVLVHAVRGMPWRRPFDPTLDAEGRSQRAYEVWISEVMLQQTQVITVKPYYKKWMEKYPTIRELARSDIESVNTLWKGLGYYSRAARLLAGAQKVVKEYDGRFPQSAKEMMANVPGIGRYSAGAIASIAYNHCEPVLDGNVMRVLSRVLALYANTKAKSTLDTLWAGAAAMVDHADSPGDINQALIELGATVCKPRDPNCGTCPINAHCTAFREAKGQTLIQEQDIEEICSLCEPYCSDEDVNAGVTRYPMKVQRKKAREEMDVVNVIEWLKPGTQVQRYILLARRPEKGLLAGLHEFPSCSDVKDANTPDVLRDIVHRILHGVLARPPGPFMPSTEKDEIKLEVTSPKAGIKEDVYTSDQLRVTKMLPAGDVLHIFSHIRKTYRIQWILLEGGGNSDSKALPPEVNSSYGFGNALSQQTGSKTTSKRKEKKQDILLEEDGALAIGVRWVRLEDVEDANISTGMMKVWNKMKQFWAQMKAEEDSSKYWDKFHRSR